MGSNEYAYEYDAIGHQKSAKPKRLAAPGERDFEAVRTHGARSRNRRRNGNRCRLVSAISNDVLLVSNTYDPQSRRIAKVISCGGAETQRRDFIYDGWDLILELVTDNGSLTTRSFTWGADLSGNAQGAGGVGGLLAVTSVSFGTSYLLPLTYYPSYDANGNVTAYLDSTGGVAAAWDYDPFGNTISEAVSPGLHLPHRFSTKYLDPETGMYCYGYRFYHPELGRWVSRDPIGERGGPGLYVLAGNSAVCVVDLFGLLTLVIGETIVQIVTEGEIPKFFKIGEIGHYDSGESLSCVSKACDTKAICSSLECKLTAKPVVRLHPDPKIRNEPFRWKNKEDISHEQHERNHHQVFLNVYVESYKVLVAEYEGMCCKNADKRYVELLERYEKLKTRLKQWEFATEYFWYKTHPLPNNYDPTLDTEWGHAQPYKDYGTKKAVLKSNTPSTVACDPGGH